ncbi:MAG: DNA methyltransferase [Geminocystis sp.]|nr:DNA methyltransferase [Geminocystis sp.]
MTIKEASKWASKYLNRRVTVSNIYYLLQYGRISKYGADNTTLIDLDDLKSYYDSLNHKKNYWEKVLGKLNWKLAFSEYKESERTKHVHGLHPYKGKFIPQLVEYFIDPHTDEFKKEIYFYPGDIVLDPFCGSGTTLVQANELGIHAIGVDVSFFNTLISKIKVANYNLLEVTRAIYELTRSLKGFQGSTPNRKFESELSLELSWFNAKYFPSPEFKIKVVNREVNEDEYGREKEQEFQIIYNKLLEKYNIRLKQDNPKSFLEKWYLLPVREELDFLAGEIKNMSEGIIKDLLMVILSRTARSCRATTHVDLATLKNPVFNPYYCRKHKKICKPIFSILDWWEKYTKDSLRRLKEFQKVRTNTFQICIGGDSRTIDIYGEIKKINPDFAQLVQNKKIKGIFTSPPYVGLIDYHEQHAYAYEIFGFERKDELEIGPLHRGRGEEAKKSYVVAIAEVLKNSKKYLQDDYNVFLIANDKFNLYPKIADIAGMRIVNEFKRPVLCRVEKDRENPYGESIFHLKEK